MSSSQAQLQTIANDIKYLHAEMGRDIDSALKTSKLSPKGNKTAARRARVTSGKLRELYKEYRKLSTSVIG